MSDTAPLGSEAVDGYVIKITHSLVFAIGRQAEDRDLAVRAYAKEDQQCIAAFVKPVCRDPLRPALRPVHALHERECSTGPEFRHALLQALRRVGRDERRQLRARLETNVSARDDFIQKLLQPPGKLRLIISDGFKFRQGKRGIDESRDHVRDDTWIGVAGTEVGQHHNSEAVVGISRDVAGESLPGPHARCVCGRPAHQ
jgi:hypothetical protein